jgi:hypothetical protein
MRCLCAIGALFLALTVNACAPLPGHCGAAERQQILDTLYFGTARPGGVVSEGDWRGFIDRVVTPRFPQGLTHWAAAGQWRGARGPIEREGTRVLQLVHGDDEAAERAVQEIAQSYKVEFQQEAVLRVQSRACVSF